MSRKVLYAHNDSIAKLFAAFLRRAEESLIGRVAVQVSVLLAVSRTNGASALNDAAAVYKVDTDAIVAKVKQEFAAKANAAKKPPVKVPSKAKKAA